MNKLFNNKIHPAFICIVILIVCIQIFFYKVCFFDENFFWRDILSHSYPAKKIFVDAVLAGYFPFWNPYITLGIPYLADLSNQPLYFSNLIFLLLPACKAINCTVLLHYFLCSIFTFLFLDRLLKDVTISLFGTLMYTLSGYCISLSSNLEYLSTIAWIPAVLWSFYKLLETQKTLYLLLSGIFLSQLIFCGDPMTFYYLCGFMLLRGLFEIKDKTVFKRYIIFLIICIIVSLILSAVQLLPAMELTSLSVRSGGLDFREATTWSFAPGRILELYLPFFYGHNLPYPVYWGGFLIKGSFDVPWAEGVYLSTFGFLLATCSLFYNRNKEKIFWVVVLLISLVLAFGLYTPIYKLLFNILPLFSSFRYPEKLILFTSLAASILAAMGLKDLVEFKPSCNKWTIALMIIFLAAGAYLIHFDFSTLLSLKTMKISGDVTNAVVNENFRFKLIYFMSFVVLFVLSWLLFSQKVKYFKFFVPFIIVITFCDLMYINSNAFITANTDFFNLKIKVNEEIKQDWKEIYPPRVFGSGYLPNYFPNDLLKQNKKKFLENFYIILNCYWLENLIPNRSTLYNLDLIQTVSSLQIKSVSNLSSDFFLKDNGKFFKNLNINYILASPLDIDNFKNNATIMYPGTYNVLLRPNSTSNRAIMVFEALYFPDTANIDYRFISDLFDVTQTIMFKSDDKYREEFLTRDDNYKANITHYDNNKVVIDLSTKQTGYLLLMDSYFPGWKVFIDGKESEILQADHIYRAVKVPPGDHVVRFIFDPPLFKVGLIITLLGFIGLIFVTFRVKSINF